jgi:hypothetical protein
MLRIKVNIHHKIMHKFIGGSRSFPIVHLYRTIIISEAFEQRIGER